MGNIARAGASSLVSMVSGASALLILVIATRSDQLAAVAGFGAGMAATAIAAAVFGAGTTLSFANGDRGTKSAVMAVRVKFVLPTLMLCSLCTAVVYSALGPLPFSAIIAGGLSVALNNLAELELAHLKSELRTLEILVAALVSRVLGIVLAFQTSYHVAMFAMAAIYFLILYPMARRGGGFPPLSSASLKQCLQESVRTSFLGATVLESLNARLPFLVAGLGVMVSGLPELSSLLSAQQGIIAALIAVLFTTMAFRSGSVETPQWMIAVEKLTILLSVLVAGALVVCGPTALRFMGLADSSDVLISWYLLAAAIPVSVWNRKFQYFEFTLRAGRRFLLRLALVFAGVLAACLISVILGDPRIVASSWLIGEVFGALFNLVVLFRPTAGPLAGRPRGCVLGKRDDGER